MKLPTKKAGTAFVLLSGALALSAPAGCFALGAGLDPPLQQFYYPTSVLTSPGGRTLYVVNSDFDIQYTGGTVQAVDLVSLRACAGRLRDDLARGSSAENACRDVGLEINDNSVLVPGPCSPIPVDGPIACTLGDDPATEEKEGTVLGPLVRSSRVIGAFASSAALVRNPDESATGARLFVTVRGDPSVTYFDTTDDARDPEADAFRLECQPFGPGDPALGGRCDRVARVGDSPYESARELTLPVEPVGIAAGDDGRSVVTVHLTGAAASLVTNEWDGHPALEHILSGLSDGPTDVAPIPTPAIVGASAQLADATAALADATADPSKRTAALDFRPGFLVTYRASRNVDIVRTYDDSESTLQRHFLQRVASFPVLTNADGSDSRGLAVDGTERRACEAPCEPAHRTCTEACACADGDDAEACATCRTTCAESYLACARPCADIPIGVYVANRAPASLLVGKLETKLVEEGGQITSALDTLSLTDMVPLTAGPSRVVVGDVLDEDGRRVPRVFVVSFDSRYLVIYDPHLRRVEAALRTGRGPHALAVDIAPDQGETRGHALLYVAHFTDSYIGVVDLDTRNARTYGSMFASIGQPTPPKESN